jgi:RNA polymerase sigma factor (sigma-70 family)
MSKKRLMINDDSFKLYSKELTKMPQMNPKREKEIVSKMLDPLTDDVEKKALKDEMVKGYLRYVIKEVNKFQFAGVDMVDLIQAGNLGLINAIENFDWSSGNRFTTYCYHWIKQGILACIYENARTIRLPINVAQELHRQIKSLNNGKGELDSEMSNLPNTIDLQQSISGEDETSTLLDVIKNTNALIPDYEISNKDLIDKLFSKLSERENKVLTMYYGLDGKDWDIKEIADELGIHKESVRLTKIKAEEKLKKSFAF